LGKVEGALILTASQCSSGPVGPLVVSPIEQAEIDAAVYIFLNAFRDNVRLIYGTEPKPDAMRDVWTFVRDVEPGGFLAARNGADLIGYAIFTHSIKTLQRRALREGKLLVWTARALSGRYGIRWFHVGRLLWNKVLFVGGAARFRTAGDAQLLNIAVSPAARGKGVAKALVRAGLRYLAQRKAPEVRLEVRPDNLAAIAAYRDNGFVERGRTSDAGGEWLVMTAHP